MCWFIERVYALRTLSVDKAQATQCVGEAGQAFSQCTMPLFHRIVNDHMLEIETYARACGGRPVEFEWTRIGHRVGSGLRDSCQLCSQLLHGVQREPTLVPQRNHRFESG